MGRSYDYPSYDSYYLDTLSHEDVQKLLPDEYNHLVKLLSDKSLSLYDLGIALEEEDFTEIGEEAHEAFRDLQKAFFNKTGFNLFVYKFDSEDEDISDEFDHEEGYFYVGEEILELSPKAKILKDMCPSLNRSYYVKSSY